MGCIHTHQRMPAIEGWGGPSRVQNVVQKTKEDHQKARKTGRVVSQVPTFELEHNKIWAQKALNVLLKNMLERV